MRSQYIEKNSGHKDSFQVGLEYQDFVFEQLARQLGMVFTPYTSYSYQKDKGESLQGVEIKLDARMVETKQLSIEVAEKSKEGNYEFIPSGIYCEDNTWLYVQGNYDVIFIFCKKYLRRLHQSGKYQEHELPTIKKFYLPIDHAFKICTKVIKPLKLS